MTVQSRECFFLLYRCYEPYIALTFRIQRSPFEFPETCYIKNNVLLETMWCVLLLIMRGLWDVHHCVPFEPIIHLCGGLAVWIIFASFDKGTHTITYNIWFCYISVFWPYILRLVFFMYCKYLLSPHPSIHVSKAWWAFDITIKTWILLFLNRNVAGNKKLKNLK